MEPRVKLAAESEWEEAAEVLALAFADDPAWIHLLPHAPTRVERLCAFFMAEIESTVPARGQLWVTETVGGAALWTLPGHWRAPLMDTLLLGPRMAKVFGRRLPLALWTQLRLERHHPRPKHWYLHYLGVEPRHQGRGLGGALLAPVLALCDREQSAAYLEATTERGQALYARNGFRTTGDVDMPAGGPPLHEMWREPRRAETESKTNP